MKKLLLCGILLFLVLSVVSFAEPTVYPTTEVVFTDAPPSDIVVTGRSLNNDFIVSSDYSGFSMCKCGTVTDVVTITNAGSYPSSYSITANMDVTFSEQDFSLQPGMSKSILVYITAACDASVNNILTFTVSSALGTAKQLTQQLSYQTCQNTAVGVLEPEVSTSVCTPFDSTVRVENTGPFQETYTITPTSFVDYVTLSTEQITLPSGRFVDIVARYQLPCDIYGNYSLGYDVVSQKNNLFASVSQPLSISPDYNFSISLNKENLNTCDTQNNSLRLFIENFNHFTDYYTIDVDAPSYVQVHYPLFEGEPTNVIELANATYIDLSIDPAVYDVGSDEIVITVTSNTGNVAKQLRINSTVAHCYDFDLVFDMPEEVTYACGKDVASRILNIKSKGETDVTLDLSLYGPDFVSINQTSVFVPAKKTVPVLVHLNSVANVEGEYAVNVTANRLGRSVAESSFMLKTNTAEFCYNNSMDDVIEVVYDKNDVWVAISNEGSRNGLFDIDVYDEPNYLDSQRDEVFIADHGVIQFSIDHQKLGQAAEQYNNGSVIGLESTFSVVATHKDTDTEFTHNITLRFVDKPIWQKVWEKIYYTNNCILFMILLLFLIVFSLMIIIYDTGFRNKKSFAPRYWILIVMGLITLIALTASLIIYGVPFGSHYNTITNSTTQLRLVEDEAQTYSFEDFFYDADDNIVSYGISESPFLNYSLENSTFTLTPYPDWNGNTTLVLFAQDAYGEMAVSDTIRVTVLPVEDLTWFEWLLNYCAYVNVFLLFVLTILVFVAFSFEDRQSRIKQVSQLAPHQRKMADEKTVKKKRHSNK